MRMLQAVFCCACLASAGSAQVISWTGGPEFGGDDRWATGRNWSVEPTQEAGPPDASQLAQFVAPRAVPDPVIVDPGIAAGGLIVSGSVLTLDAAGAEEAVIFGGTQLPNVTVGGVEGDTELRLQNGVFQLESTLVTSDADADSGASLVVRSDAVAAMSDTMIATGVLPDSTGRLTVDGGVALTDKLDIGVTGNGFLDIVNGTFVGPMASPTVAGKAAGGHGTINVDGSNSEFSTNTLILGDLGSGELNITNGGRVEVENLLVSGRGVVAVQDADSTLDLSIALMEPGSRLAVSGEGTIRIGEGNSVSGALNLMPGGGLFSNGTITGNVVQSGGIFSTGPNFGVGSLSIEGDYTLREDATINFDLGGRSPGEFDTLEITGDASLGGILDVIPGDGFDLQAGDLFRILTATNVDASGLMLAPDDAGQFELVTTQTRVMLRFACGGGAAIEGDMTGDGIVGVQDFLILSRNFGQMIDEYTSGDLDCNGEVNIIDFLVLSRNFGRSTVSPTPSAMNVPEPNVGPHRHWPLAAMSLLYVLRRKRRRHPMKGVDEVRFTLESGDADQTRS